MTNPYNPFGEDPRNINPGYDNGMGANEDFYNNNNYSQQQYYGNNPNGAQYYGNSSQQQYYGEDPFQQQPMGNVGFTPANFQVNVVNQPAQPYSPMAYQSDKSYIAAALLAFFLGSIGIHNFYLGYTGRGAAQLLMTICGWFTSFILIGFIPLTAVYIWAFVEFLLIIFRSGTYAYDSQGRRLR